MYWKSGKKFDLVRARFAGALMAAAACGYGAATFAETAARPPFAFIPLLATSKTVMDEPIVYPAGEAELTAGIMSMNPGDATGWHTHNVPLAGIVLEGEITVDYGDKRTRTYKTGEAIAEAMAVPHRGINKGDKPLRVFVIYMGAKGVPVTAPLVTQPDQQPKP